LIFVLVDIVVSVTCRSSRCWRRRAPNVAFMAHLAGRALPAVSVIDGRLPLHVGDCTAQHRASDAAPCGGGRRQVQCNKRGRAVQAFIHRSLTSQSTQELVVAGLAA
jgi:hypothetical protein